MFLGLKYVLTNKHRLWGEGGGGREGEGLRFRFRVWILAGVGFSVSRCGFSQKIFGGCCKRVLWF